MIERQANDKMGSLASYFADKSAEEAGRGLRSGTLAEVVRAVLPFDARESLKIMATKLLMPVSRRKATRLAQTAQPLRIQLGAGLNRLQGWVNVDLLGFKPDLPWDLGSPLPFSDASVDAIFVEHVLEHFTALEALEVLAECRRLLKPQGILRVVVPDFGRYIQSYAGDQSFIEETRPGRPTAMLALAEVVFDHGHRSAWDAATLIRSLEEVGFTDVEERTFGDSAIQPSPDSPARRPESLYVEGRGA